jgi:SAM-dependent methyltransferase
VYRRKLSHLYSHFNRRRKLRFLSGLISRHQLTSGLIVGAKPRSDSSEFDNLVERGLVQILPTLVVSGIEAESTSWQDWVQADALSLPFEDSSFDLVFSNAVIEHVGNEIEQIKFVNEHNRVGKNWVLTTLNRLFPIESHTQKLFIHMSRGWMHGNVTRLLSKRDLRKILPPDAKIKGYWFSPTFLGYRIAD